MSTIPCRYAVDAPETVEASQQALQIAWLTGQVDGISKSVESLQSTLCHHGKKDAWQALQEAMYALNRAHLALGRA